ncbi:MAG TPA: dynamin family protein [Methanoregula sp.]|nr:dynamin family protein [Methanoregula sp.]
MEIMDSRYGSYARRLDELEKRLSQGRFYLAVLGQVKRGKSTLLNALLGEDVLPSSVVPLTAIPTFIEFGEHRMLRVRYNDDRPDTVMKGEPAQWLNKQLMAYVTEDANPKNVKGVLQVEITHPAAILRDVVLIDTPGIGSTYRHNTEATMNFLPQCDAALFVVSADPPITEVELAFLREIKSRVARLFFVLNKADYLTDGELVTALGFYRNVLTREAGVDPSAPVFPVSARRGLQAKEAGSGELWVRSGLSEVFDHLIGFLALEKSRVLREAIGRKALDVFRDIDLQIGLEIRALELPLADLEARLACFDRKIAEAEEQRVHARDILNGDHRRVLGELEEHIRNLRKPLRDQLAAIAERAIAASPGDPEQAAQQAMAGTIPVWFERELGTLSAMMDAGVARFLKSHERRAGELAESIRRTAAELFEIPYSPAQGERVYEPARKPYWVDHEWESSFSPVPARVIERCLPRSLRGSRARDRLKRQIDLLVMRNLENLRWETLQNIDTAFRKFGIDLDASLAGTIEATHGAMNAALNERRRHEASAGACIDELKRMATEIRGVIELFGAG